jgi:hypothetical protein
MYHEQWEPQSPDGRWPSETTGWLDAFQSLSGAWRFDEVAADVGPKARLGSLSPGWPGPVRASCLTGFGAGQ